MTVCRLAIVKELKCFLQRILLMTLSSTRRGSIRFVTFRQVLLTFSEGIIGRKLNQNVDRFVLLEEIEKLWNLGKYRESVSLRSHLLEKMYMEFGVDKPDYSPPIYSPQFTSTVGHLPMFLLHQCLVQKGEILSTHRILPVMKRSVGTKFIKMFNLERLNVQSVEIESEGLTHEIPSIMHLFERLDCFKTVDGFRDIYELFEESYSGRRINQEFPILNLSEELSNEMRLNLKEKGLLQDNQFVTVHIRVPNGKLDPRGADYESFKASIQLLLRKGLQVVAVGGVNDKPIGIDGVIEIKGVESFTSQIFCLANALFHLGTQAGPTELAKSLGTPVLQTNVTSLGRNTFTGSDFTMYLAKHIFRDRHKLSLSEILNSPVAYAETLGIATSGVRVLENSSQEILQGVEDMLYVVSRKDRDFCTTPNSAVNIIRSELKSPARGNFSPSFLASNPHFTM